MENHGAHLTLFRPHTAGGREDCWSEGATATLIHAWGDRYLQLSRGNLRQKDWKDIADAVNARQDTVNKPRKTDVQCKNRIDTIKKKYKLERSKPAPSKWPFYTHLDDLIGTNVTPKPPTPAPAAAAAFTVKTYKPNPSFNYNSNTRPSPNPILYSGGSSSKSRMNSAGSTGSSHGGGEDEDDCVGDEDNMANGGTGGGGGERKHEAVRDSLDGDAFRDLAKAILKFGETYERIESSKQQQIMELEKQRMEFTKELEFQRMQMFMEAQLELQKTKRPKYARGNGESAVETSPEPCLLKGRLILCITREL